MIQPVRLEKTVGSVTCRSCGRLVPLKKYFVCYPVDGGVVVASDPPGPAVGWCCGRRYEQSEPEEPVYPIPTHDLGGES